MSELKNNIKREKNYMKKNTPLLTAAIIWLFLIGATSIGFFLLIFNKTQANWWGLIFCLFSETLLFLIFILFKIISMKINKVFIRLGVFAALIIYFTAALILCIFSNSFNNHFHLYIFIQILLLVLVGTVVVLFFIFSNRIKNADMKKAGERKPAGLCEIRVYDMLINTGNKKYRPQLAELYEKIRLCDNFGSLSQDEKILKGVGKLEEQLKDVQKDDESIKNTIDEITALVTKRKENTLEF
jgi:hypothetical protein